MAVPMVMAPAPVVAVVPAPMTAMPAVVMAMAPVHLFGPQLIDLLARGHGRTNVFAGALADVFAGARGAMTFESQRHERSGGRGGRERGGADCQT